MPKGVYAVASAMIQEQRSLDAVAENLANVRTGGYRQVHAVRQSFAEFYAEQRRTGIAGDGGAGVLADGVWRDVGSGQMETTGAPLDLALGGRGQFVLRRDEGDLVLSRDGGFDLDASRRLVNRLGWPVQGQGGAVVVPEEAQGVVVDGAGRVYAQLEDGQTFIDQLRIADVDEQTLRGLQAVNGQYFVAGETRLEDLAEPVIHQGVREGSNVDPLQELVRMVALQRRADAAQRALTTQLGLDGIGDILRG